MITIGVCASCATDATAADWVDMRAFGPFVCRSEFSLAGYESVFADLGRIQNDLVQRLGIAPAEERIEMYLFKDRTSYHAYVKQWLPKVPTRRALYVKNRGPGMVLAYRSDALAVDLRHESTHALLHAALSMVPLWLDEGLAEYYEVLPEGRSGDNPHHGRHVWSLRVGQVPRLDRLETKGSLDEMGRSEYRNAWAWTHFLLHGPPEARRVLIQFLADIRAGTPPGRMSDKLALKFADPERAMVQHFKAHPR